MTKSLESLLGFLFVSLPFAVVFALGIVHSWDYERAFYAVPNDPFSMGATGVLGLYAVALVWLISKAVRVAKAKKKK